jgi:GNAT superfamily N-acetyltransferase
VTPQSTAAVRDLDELLATLAPRLDATTFAYAVVPPDAAVPGDVRDAAIASVEEHEGTTLVLPVAIAERHGVPHSFRSRRITLQVHSDLEAVGLTAAFATALAAEGVPANVLAGFHHDHLLVPEGQAELAHAVLVDLSRPPTARPATGADEDVLWRMLRLAAAAAPDEEPRADAYLARYVAGWGRPDDHGVVAVGASGRPVGAAWCRPLTAGLEHELAVAVVASQRGRGVGQRLLEALFAALRDAEVPAVRLMVRQGNPAARLYRRLGFATVGTETNRVGGASWVMRLDLATHEGGA